MVYGVTKKPNFFIVGAAKSGTTSLAKYLSAHPDIFIPPAKEPRYFVRKSLLAVSNEDPMKKSIIESSILDEEKYFQAYNVDEPLAGDASVHYLYHHKEVIPQIKETLGDVPIIIMIRNPVERYISHYSFLPGCKQRIEEELACEEEKKRRGYNSFWYLKELGFYYDAIIAYKSHFSNVKIIVFEDFIKNTEKYYQECLKLLNVKNSRLTEFTVHNQTVKATSLLSYASKLKINKLFKKLLPQVVHRYIRDKLSTYLYRPQKEVVSIEFKMKLKNIYTEDMEKLQAMGDIDIDSWLKNNELSR